MKRSLLLILALGLACPTATPAAEVVAASADYQNRLILAFPALVPDPNAAQPLSISIFGGAVGPAGNTNAPNNGQLWLERAAFGFPVAAALNLPDDPIIVPVKLLVEGNGTIIRNPDQPVYTNGQLVTLTAVEGNCYWRFSHWSDGDTNNPRTITVGLSNCFTAVFTNMFSPIGPFAEQWQRSFGGSGPDVVNVALAMSDGGVVLGGQTDAVADGNKTIPGFGSADFWVLRLDRNGTKLWERVFGGTGYDALTCGQQTADGGFIFGGFSDSGATGNKESSSYGQTDSWVVRLDADGNKLWDRSFGGNGLDQMYSLQQTADGGFMLGGASWSPPSGTKDSPLYGLNDWWVVRLDAGGNKLWDRSYGGSGHEDGVNSLRQTSDGGFAFGGVSRSPADGNKTAPNWGDHDFWVVRTDSAGNVLWDRSFGGGGGDGISSLEMTADGGFIVGGDSLSGVSGNKTSAGFGGSDMWIVRLDAAGNKLWDRSFGGVGSDGLNTISRLADGGFVLGGGSSSPQSASKTSTNYGSTDIWIVRVDADGNKLWEQSFGGSGAEAMYNGVVEAADGGLIIAGYSSSPPGGSKTSPHYGDIDFWVFKLGLPPPPPLVACPSNMVVECAGTNGAVASFNVTAVDACGTNLAVVCLPASGALFPPGTTTVACVAVDARGMSNSCSFTVTVRDTTPPVLTCPANLGLPTVRWTRPVGREPDAYGGRIAVDAAGNSYITGGFQGAGTFGTNSVTSHGGLDIYLAKYDSGGNVIWSRQFGGGAEDFGAGIALDAQGRIYITGVFRGTVNFGGTSLTSGGTVTAFIAKFDNDGNFLWATRPEGPGNTIGQGIAVDAVGNSYVSGYFGDGAVTFGNVTLTSRGSGDVFVAKYDTAGNFLWVRQGGGSNSDQGAGIAVDGAGNVYVTGSLLDSAMFEGVTLASGGSFDFFVAKYDSSGNLAWARRGAGVFGDRGFGIAVGSGGNSFVTGYADGDDNPANNSELFVAKYDPDGNQVWFKKYGGGRQDEGAAITLDSSENVYVSGSLNKYNSTAPNPINFGGISVSSAGKADVVIAKLDSGGNVVWAVTTGGAENDYGYGIALDGGGNVYVHASTGMPPWGVSAAGTGSQDALIKIGSELVVETDPGRCDAVVHYLPPVATDCSSVTVACVPASGSTFAKGMSAVTCTATDGAGNSNQCNFTITVVDPPPVPVKTLVQGEGMVTRTPEQTLYTNCEVVMLTATPTNCHWAFSHWTDGAATNAANPLTITVGPTNCYTAVFTNQVCPCVPLAGPFRLVLPAPTGGGYIAPEPFQEVYECRTPVTLTAVPAQGWKFLQWLGDASGTNPATTVIMDGNKCVQALFGTMGFSTGVAGGGSVRRFPEAAAYPHGTVVRLVAVPAAGQYFARWSGAASGTNSPLNFTIADDNPSITATFAALPAGQFALTVIPEGRGRVAPTLAGGTNLFTRRYAGYYASGTVVTNVALPEPGEGFLGWSGDTGGASVVHGTNLAVTLDRSRVITARFSARPRLEAVTCLGRPYPDHFRMRLAGEFGEAYRIDATEDFVTEGTNNLTTWTPLAIVETPYGLAELTDRFTTNGPRRFYRAAQPTNNAPPLVELTSPEDGAVLAGPTNVLLTASAADADGRIVRVEFFTGANKVGEALAPAYAVTWSNAPPGCHTLTARATDSLGATAVSDAVSLCVTSAVANCAVETLADYLGVPAGSIAVAQVEAVTWGDVCLGCPPPGVLCAQIPVDGHRIVLWAGGQFYMAHTSGSRAILCDAVLQRPLTQRNCP